MSRMCRLMILLVCRLTNDTQNLFTLAMMSFFFIFIVRTPVGPDFFYLLP